MGRGRREEGAGSFSREALAAATRAASSDRSCGAAALAAGSALLAGGDAAEARGEFARALALLSSREKDEQEETGAPACESRVFCNGVPVPPSSSSLTPADVAAVGLARARAALGCGGSGGEAGAASLPPVQAFPPLEALPAEERLQRARALLSSSEDSARGKEILQELLGDPSVGGDALASLAGAAAAAASAGGSPSASSSSAAALAAAGGAAARLPPDLAPGSLDRARLSVVAAALLGGASHREALEKASALLSRGGGGGDAAPFPPPPLSAAAAAAALAAAADAAASSSSSSPSKTSRLLARAAFAEPSERGHVARASLELAAAGAPSEKSARLAALALGSSQPLDASLVADAFLLSRPSSSSSPSSSSRLRSARFAAHVAPWREDCRRAAEATRG